MKHLLLRGRNEAGDYRVEGESGEYVLKYEGAGWQYSIRGKECIRYECDGNGRISIYKGDKAIYAFDLIDLADILHLCNGINTIENTFDKYDVYALKGES